MVIHSETAVVVILLSGLLAQWLAWRLKVPGIVLLTIAGVLLGPVSGIIVPARDFGAGLSTFVQLSVAIILFEGGLNLRFHELGEAQTGVRRLVVLGLPFSFLMGTLAAVQIGGLSWPSALLFGAIIVVTGPTVILPLLRQARLKARPSALLKWEGIVNDPLGALLAVAVFEYFTVAHGEQSDIALLAGFALMLRLPPRAGVRSPCRDLYLDLCGEKEKSRKFPVSWLRCHGRKVSAHQPSGHTERGRHPGCILRLAPAAIIHHL